MLSRIPRARQPDSADPEEPPVGQQPRSEQILELQRGIGNRAVQRMLKSGGLANPIPFRSRMESAFGEDFSRVRARTGEAERLAKLGATAAAHGEEVTFASSDPDARTVAHELTHVVQARRLGEPATDREISAPSDPAEQEARTVSDRALSGERVSVSAAPSAAISLNPNPAAPPPTVNTATPPNLNVFETAAASASAAGAVKAVDEYGKMAASDRRKAYDLSSKSGALAKVLKVLPPEDAAETFPTQVRELIGWIEETDQPQARQLLRSVEEAETRKASGQTDVQMADTQAKFLSDPKNTDVIKKTAYAGASKSRWELLSDDDKRKDWTKRGVAAIASEVAYAAKIHPELKLTNASFKLGFHEIDKVASGALAMGGSAGGKNIAVVGFEFVTAVEADPAYALSTVVHEIWGHPEFDDPVASGYHLDVWRKATPKVPAYSASASNEENSIGYDETEIYALLRELPYWTAVAPQHKDVANPDPRILVEGRLKRMEKEWDPSLLPALLHGIYKRFSLDSHITAMALAAFAALIQKRFPKEAASILK